MNGLFATLFTLANIVVAPFWALMIFLPLWSGTQRVMRSPLIALPPALIYSVFVLPRLPHDLPILMQSTLAKMAPILGSGPGATLAWAHIVTGDLLVGRWIYLDSRARGLNVWLMVPVLFFALFAGPIGFVLYLIVCAFAGRARPLSALGTDIPVK
ncbi:MAG: ABA4-like family protein [Armatimonadota bacterium]|nr:ABA4-like family protein [Armatimonadota bacterium]